MAVEAGADVREIDHVADVEIPSEAALPTSGTTGRGILESACDPDRGVWMLLPQRRTKRAEFVSFAGCSRDLPGSSPIARKR